MAKKQQPKNYNVAALQPDEINELRRLVQEYVKRKQTVENEIVTLKADLKELDEEFSEKLDLKTLKLAEKQLALIQGVAYKDTFDLFCAAIDEDGILEPGGE